MRWMTLLALLTVALVGWTQTQTDSPAQMQHKVMAAANIKTQPMDFLPACMKIAPVRGDPFKEAATIYADMTANCTVPFHWHTPAEELMMVSGKAKLEMKDGKTENLSAGSYVSFPPKNVHQFTCSTKCTFYLVSAGQFDIHYVDEQGNEIPLEKALKQPGKPVGAR